MIEFIRWTTKKLNSWERLRVKGQNYYVWRRGVLGFGLLIFFFMFAINHVTSYGYVIPGLEHIEPQKFIIRLIISPVIGFFWGRWTWVTTEKSYKRHIANN